MEKSLRSILDEEAKLVDNINHALDLALSFQNKCDQIRNIPIDCECKNADIAFCESTINHYYHLAEEYKQQLDSVRNDLMAYISNLFS